jgi:hypothetical protein
VIRVGVGEENRIELGQGFESDARQAHPRQESAEGGVEIGVGQEPLALDLN